MFAVSDIVKAFKMKEKQIDILVRALISNDLIKKKYVDGNYSSI